MAEQIKFLDKEGVDKLRKKTKNYVANAKTKVIDFTSYFNRTSDLNGLPASGTINIAGVNLLKAEIDNGNDFVVLVKNTAQNIDYYFIPSIYQDGYLIMTNAIQTTLQVYQLGLTGSYNFTLQGYSLIDATTYNNDKTQLESKITANTNSISSLTTEVNKKINNSEKGSANGVATLDENSKVPYAQLPDKLLGQLKYGGVLEKTSTGSGTFTIKPNANLAHDLEILGHSGDTNLDALDFNDEEVVSTLNGYFLIASFGGSTNQEVGPLGLTGVSTGDWIVFNGFTSSDSSGAVAFKIDNTDAVASVNGKIGVVTINAEDVGMVAITSAELEEILV